MYTNERVKSVSAKCEKKAIALKIQIMPIDDQRGDRRLPSSLIRQEV
jgi:hypothetical protein